MQFFYDGKIYKAIRITGPEHNMLGLIFTETKRIFSIEVIDLEKNQQMKKINPSEVESQVMEALSEVNKKFNVKYKIKKIEFISSDTPSSRAYKILTKAIINRLSKGMEFKKIN